MATLEDSHPLDLIMIDPHRGLQYLTFELLLGIIWSLLIALPSHYYLFSYYDLCLSCDSFLTHWLLSISALRTLDLPLKCYLLKQLFNIKSSMDSEDPRFTTRRLILFVRNWMFGLLSKLNVLFYLLFVIGVIRLWQAGNCAAIMPQFYKLCLLIMLFLVLRIFLGIVRFYYEQNYAETNGFNQRTRFLMTGATINQIEALGVQVVDSTGAIQGRKDLTCVICTEDFLPNQKIRGLPCVETHVFHKSCIDRWLIEVQSCPLCNQPIKTKDKNV